MMYRQTHSRGWHHQRRSGNVVVLTAVMMVFLMGMVAFAVDVGYIAHARTELQRTADSCAMAASQVLPDFDAALDTAQGTAMQNYGTIGTSILPEDVEVGHWDRDEATFHTPTPEGKQLNAVRVTLNRTAVRGNQLALFFGGILGTSHANVTASAISMYDNSACGPFVGIDWLDATGTILTDSYDSDEGPYDAAAARDRGSICSDGPIALDGTIDINGDAVAGKTSEVTLSGGANVTGGIGTRLKPLNMPSVDDSEAELVNDNGQIPLIHKGNSWVSPVDAAGNFLLDGTKTLTLPPGTYYLNNLTLSGQATLNVTGPTTIYVTGAFERAGGTVVNNFTQKAENLSVLVTGGSVNMTSYDNFYGVIYAPDSDVNLDGDSHIFGAVIGRTLTVAGGGEGHYDESLHLVDGVNMPRRTALVD